MKGRPPSPTVPAPFVTLPLPMKPSPCPISCSTTDTKSTVPEVDPVRIAHDRQRRADLRLPDVDGGLERDLGRAGESAAVVDRDGREGGVRPQAVSARDTLIGPDVRELVVRIEVQAAEQRSTVHEPGGGEGKRNGA